MTDIGALWARSHIAVLPSRREGLPKSLLEAAPAAGRSSPPMSPAAEKSRAPDVNALLVPADDPQALAEALARLAHDAALRRASAPRAAIGRSPNLPARLSGAKSSPFTIGRRRRTQGGFAGVLVAGGALGRAVPRAAAVRRGSSPSQLHCGAGPLRS